MWIRRFAYATEPAAWLPGDVPFTGSHPAAVLPLLGTRLPASALVIGSVAPDLPYFVPLHAGAWYLPWTLSGPSHAWWGVPTLDVMLGALAWLLWHGVLAAPAVALAPWSLRARFAGRVRLGLRRRLHPRGAALTALGLAIGAGTHVGWDEFTHAGRWGPAHLPVLDATWAGLPGHAWAQHLSSLVGAMLCAGHLVRWWRRSPPRPGRAPSVGWSAGVVWSVVAALGLGVGVAASAGIEDPQAAAFMLATRAGAAGLAAVMTVALLWHARRALVRMAS